MKSRPILFSAPMIRALLDGSKTQTRRVIKPQPVKSMRHEEQIGVDDRGLPVVLTHPEGMRWRDLFVADESPASFAWHMAHDCPYGRVGDRLWVRETWRTDSGYDDYSPLDIARDSGTRGADVPVEYVADGARVHWPEEAGRAGKTRVSIHMPRWASRITLEVTDVRVERLQDITEQDAVAEGVRAVHEPTSDVQNGYTIPARDKFAELWASINGAESWDANPWVWVVEFRRVEVPRG